MGHDLRCPDCGSLMERLNVEDTVNNLDGSTHYCEDCNQRWLIVWQGKGEYAGEGEKSPNPVKMEE